jgi:hypothetical protein
MRTFGSEQPQLIKEFRAAVAEKTADGLKSLSRESANLKHWREVM